MTVSSGRGGQELKARKKMFAMFYKGQLLLKVPPGRVNELIASGDAISYDPGTGKTMKDRVLIPDSKKAGWIDLCEESRRYAEWR